MSERGYLIKWLKMVVYKQILRRKCLLCMELCGYVHLGVKLCPIAFGANIMYGYEWAGLNLKILEWQYISVRMAD